MNREESIRRIRQREQPWDIAVIGGGATGVAIALDASARRLDVLLVERSGLTAKGPPAAAPSWFMVACGTWNRGT